MAEIRYTFDLSLDQKSTKMFAKLVHRQPRKEVYDATCEGKNNQPKFKGGTLTMTHNFHKKIAFANFDLSHDTNFYIHYWSGMGSLKKLGSQ